jgi:hypothetical protein
MERRLALAAAVSAALVVSAGTAAVAANLGILRSAADEPVGQLDAKTVADSVADTLLAPVVVTVDEIVEVPVPGDAPTGGAGARPDGGELEDDDLPGVGESAPAGAGGGSTEVAPAPSVTVRADDEHEQEHEHEYEHEDEHEDDDD